MHARPSFLRAALTAVLAVVLLAPSTQAAAGAGATISGTVIDRTGIELNDRTVYLMGWDGSNPAAPYLDATTAADGSFSFAGLAPGSYVLAVQGVERWLSGWWDAGAPGHFREVLSATSVIDATAGDVTLAPLAEARTAAAVHGIVIDRTTGLPATRVRVDADEAGEFYPNADGEFILAREPGKTTIGFWGDPDGPYPSLSAVYTTGTASHITSNLNAGTMVTWTDADQDLGVIGIADPAVIRVTLPASRAGATVCAQSTSSPFADISCDTVGAGGVARIGGLDPDTYNVSMGHDRESPAIPGMLYNEDAPGNVSMDTYTPVAVSTTTSISAWPPTARHLRGTVRVGASRADIYLYHGARTSLYAYRLVQGGLNQFDLLVPPNVDVRLKVTTRNARLNSPAWWNRAYAGDLGRVAATIHIGTRSVSLGTLTPPAAANPRVLRFSPVPGRTGVSRNVTVKIVFSEVVRNVTTTTLRLVDLTTGKTVPATVRAADPYGAWLIDPVDPLPATHSFRVKPSSAITDTKGHALRVSTATFKTGT